MPQAKTRKAPKRQRRTADAAQREILDAAEARLAEAGPDALRVHDVAADVGISHPAVLHHFGSRDGLVRAVVERTVRRLKADMVRVIESAEDETSTADILSRALEGFEEGGHARLVAWLALTGHDIDLAAEPALDLARVVHARRVAQVEADEPPPDFEDSVFIVRLVTLALFGEAIVGRQLHQRAEVLGQQDVPRRFREWFAQLLVDHVDRC